jgi:hypothetical protein
MSDLRSRRGQWFEARGTEWLGEDAPPVRRPMERPEVLALVKREKRKAKREKAKARAKTQEVAPETGEVVVSINGRRVAADTVGQVLAFVERPRAIRGLWSIMFCTRAGERVTLMRDTRRPGWKHWVVDSEAEQP